MTGTRKKPKPSPVSPPVVVGLPAVIDAPQQTEHPHQNFDRAARAAVARLSGGVICCAGLASIPCRSKTDVEGRKLSFVTEVVLVFRPVCGLVKMDQGFMSGR
jgi:hypothetical protein